jgi:hypothetical protein
MERKMKTMTVSPIAFVLYILVTIGMVAAEKFLARNGFPTLTSKGLKRFILSQIRILNISVYIAISLWLLTNRNSLGQVFLAFASALMFSIIMDKVWELISPYRAPKVEDTVGKFDPKQWKQTVATVKVVTGIAFLFLLIIGIVAFIPSLATEERAGYLFLGVVLFCVGYSLPDFHYFATMIPDVSRKEEDRATLLFVLLRDPLPILVFLGILANLWRSNGPGVQMYPQIQAGWYGVLVLLILFAVNGILQYQKGVNLTRNLQETILNNCIRELDYSAGFVAISKQRRWREELDFALSLKIPNAEHVGRFSSKNIYENNPSLVYTQLVNHIRDALPRAKRDLLLEHLRTTRTATADELKNLKETRPVVFEWGIAASSILASTFLTKAAETIFEYAKQLLP